jgi:hypothetical protein
VNAQQLIEQIARLETWEERCRREYQEDDLAKDGYAGVEDYIASEQKGLDYLEAQDEALEKLIGYARQAQPAPEAAASPGTPGQLISDLWWFIENVTDETPDRTERFFALREKVRAFHGAKGQQEDHVDTSGIPEAGEEFFQRAKLVQPASPVTPITSQAVQETPVYCATWEHRHGRDTRVFASEAAAEQWRQEIAADNCKKCGAEMRIES